MELKRFMLPNANTKLSNTPLFASWDVFVLWDTVPQWELGWVKRMSSMSGFITVSYKRVTSPPVSVHVNHRHHVEKESLFALFSSLDMSLFWPVKCEWRWHLTGPHRNSASHHIFLLACSLLNTCHVLNRCCSLSLYPRYKKTL